MNPDQDKVLHIKKKHQKKNKMKYYYSSEFDENVLRKVELRTGKSTRDLTFEQFLIGRQLEKNLETKKSVFGLLMSQKDKEDCLSIATHLLSREKFFFINNFIVDFITSN